MPRPPETIHCCNCGQTRPVRRRPGRPECRVCRDGRYSLVICTACHKLSPLHSRGMCANCYMKARYQKRKSPRRPRKEESWPLLHVLKIRCVNCGKLRDCPYEIARDPVKHPRGLCVLCRTMVERRLQGIPPRAKMKGHQAPGYRGGRVVECSECGAPVGWRTPSWIARCPNGFRCEEHKARRVS